MRCSTCEMFLYMSSMILKDFRLIDQVDDWKMFKEHGLLRETVARVMWYKFLACIAFAYKKRNERAFLADLHCII